MEVWKRNMIVLCIGNFMFFVGISMIVPFLPIYVQELGISDAREAALWASGIFAVNHLFLAFFSPIWGKISDKIGQKKVLMISGVSMGLVIFSMGFVHSPLELLVLRMLFGMMGGFSVAASALVAIETPKEHKGKTLGTLQSGLVTGQLIGPVIGGLLAATTGMRSAFYMTGVFMLIAAILAGFFVKETKVYPKFKGFRQSSKPILDSNSVQNPKHSWSSMFSYPMVPFMFITSFVVIGCMQSIDPIMILYVKSAMNIENVEMVGGIMFAAAALGTIISAPLLGRIGDKRGHKEILIASVAMMAFIYLLQSMVHNPVLFIILRFLMGMTVGGLMPSVSAFLSKMTPKEIQGSLYGFNSGVMSFGSVSGAVFGGLLANFVGFTYIFYSIASLLFLHSILLVFMFKRNQSKISQVLED
jgi:DHA1 family multidrug resistance protein-like MFS transporter